MPDNNALSKVETGPPNEPKNALAVLINPHWKPLTNTEPQSLTPPIIPTTIAPTSKATKK